MEKLKKEIKWPSRCQRDKAPKQRDLGRWSSIWLHPKRTASAWHVALRLPQWHPAVHDEGRFVFYVAMSYLVDFLRSSNSQGKKKAQVLPQYYSLKKESVSPHAETNDSSLCPEEYPGQTRMPDKKTITPQTKCRVNKMRPLPCLGRGTSIFPWIWVWSKLQKI